MVGDVEAVQLDRLLVLVEARVFLNRFELRDLAVVFLDDFQRTLALYWQADNVAQVRHKLELLLCLADNSTHAVDQMKAITIGRGYLEILFHKLRL